uniref:Uncharacterized protein n=1 Tax=Gossypium raimondii TaxID=29730 RepID=A0A0D2RLB0_GOSRA|nr:hypothetical protein B456_005G252700 [Gossypium raimondii]
MKLALIDKRRMITMHLWHLNCLICFWSEPPVSRSYIRPRLNPKPSQVEPLNDVKAPQCYFLHPQDSNPSLGTSSSLIIRPKASV